MRWHLRSLPPFPFDRARLSHLNGRHLHAPPGGRCLEIRGLVKRFGGLRALDGLELEVRRGTITGLIGPNGAGKSTLFDCITGFTVPDGGQVLLDGEDITGMAPHEVFARGISRTFQIPRLHRRLSVLENLMLVPPGQLGERLAGPWLRPGAVRRQEEAIRRRALEVLDLLELTRLAHAPAEHLSGGQRKLLELGRVMMADPALVLLDEPGAGVNPTLMRTLAAAIERLREERGITFLVIEHDMELVARLCDEVVVVSEGRKLTAGPPDAVRKDPAVVEAYLGDPRATVGVET
ncbi:ABC transporter ATP-binding protein [Carboxydochorda subterranea]|uniref:ABC transporter ATP-binding protein n=1 Tax=Carboxydichorda subterranea TaxID=3109565 RepID=A0ABZ1BZD0_9FIRM|nr:ABC transporter ATP-binding protein [Limnochorda sp. L945t]WRP17925.1 ABC transporter ATP-binding protein [Limnochorda sp. L945t]